MIIVVDDEVVDGEGDLIVTVSDNQMSFESKHTKNREFNNCKFFNSAWSI